MSILPKFCCRMVSSFLVLEKVTQDKHIQGVHDSKDSCCWQLCVISSPPLSVVVSARSESTVGTPNPVGFLYQCATIKFSISTLTMPQERAWPEWSEMRKLDTFPATRESGIYGLILLFKDNSWNIIHCLLSMQKHIHCQVASFRLTSVDLQATFSLGWDRWSGCRRQRVLFAASQGQWWESECYSKCTL